MITADKLVEDSRELEDWDFKDSLRSQLKLDRQNPKLQLNTIYFEYSDHVGDKCRLEVEVNFWDDIVSMLVRQPEDDILILVGLRLLEENEVLFEDSKYPRWRSWRNWLKVLPFEATESKGSS
jgi:hypothetical protein